MWNVPYVVAIIHPRKYRLSLFQAVAMQAIGLLGESVLFTRLPGGYPQLGASILRFIIFDGSGLVALLLALLLTRPDAGHTSAKKNR